MASPDLTALETAFVGGASYFKKRVLAWVLASLGIQVRTNVNTPQAMAKLSAVGGPRPYRTQDDFDNNGVEFTDRVLTAWQSKWDFLFDSEEFRNTYLATLPDMPFEQASIDQVAKEFLDKIIRSTLWLGVRDANGDSVADLFTGWGTLIADLITAADIVPVATGAITNANAVTKVEDVAHTAPEWMREEGFIIYSSYNVGDKYKQHYRSLNGFGFDKSATEYKLDGINAVLRPVSFMGNSQRLVATVKNNLVFGTDFNRIAVHPTRHLNILKCRLMFPGGCEIQDLDALIVNDQA